MRRAALAVFALAIVSWPLAVSAQFFSPGPLARPHAALEGLDKCSKCHQEQKGLSAKLCLDCHTELVGKIAKGTGFHGRLPPAQRESCQSCHPDHRGKEFSMIEWEGGRDKFDHAKTGWPLRGGHAKAKCDDCHARPFIAEVAIRKLLDNHPKQATLLGLGTRCNNCHFDEHRGQLGLECQKCHNEVAWKPAPAFDHKATAFPLLGKHRDVKCAKCHPSLEDEHVVANAIPMPRFISFMEMKPIEHKTCESCHDDPHKGSLGPACSSCHSEAGWKIIKTAASGKDTSFHDKTRFPLRGGHVGVECRACHGPFPGQPAKFKGLAFGACSDCHADAHLGQIAPKPPAKVAACDDCHTVNAFSPVRFELEHHAKTRFPLDGAHAAVTCRGCHPVDEGLAARIPPAVKKTLQARKRPEVFSFAVLRPAKSPAACLGCHEDVHRGQLAAADKKDNCATCHKTTSFAELAFDHDRDTRFPLTGQHGQTPCASCHPTERVGAGPKTMVRYTPLARVCAGCHPDEHQGQFRAQKERPARACDFCHTTKAWKPSAFDHDDRAFTTFALEGKHAKVACGKCHPSIALAAEVKTTRYRFAPRACEACHVDFHHGEFRGFEP
jgi:hypothetical protein